MKNDFDALPLDARSALILLLFANIVAFIQQCIWVELSFFAALCILLIVCGCKIQALKWCAVFSAIAVIQYVVFPIVLKSIATAFAIIFVYARKMLPCLMVGTIIVKRIPMQYLLLALKKWHFPQVIMIPLFVTIRYIPSIKEEYRHIRDAMKLRNIRGLRKVEYTVVSLMMSAARTVDELSAAAITRGIENPCKKTSVFKMSFSALDYVAVTVALGFVVLAGLSRGGVI